SLTVAGLPELVTISGSESNDALVISGGDGNDTLSAATLPAGNTVLTLDGGSGNDNIIGSQGADLLLGGDGNDTVIGGRGNHTAYLRTGHDPFLLNPGGGSYGVGGEERIEILVFHRPNVGEKKDSSTTG